MDIRPATLCAVEKGYPSPTFGTYVRVLSTLGLVADLALVAARPALAVRKPSDAGWLERHQPQDLQSLLLHGEAVALLRADPALAGRLNQTLARWSAQQHATKHPLLQRWAEIIATRDWDAALAQTDEGQQLRQASPLPTLLPDHTRLAVIHKVRSMKDRARATAST